MLNRSNLTHRTQTFDLLFFAAAIICNLPTFASAKDSKSPAPSERIVVSSDLPVANWPLQAEIDFSSGFGDYRQGRFHAGVDLRTGGVTGWRLKSPVNGYVSRARASYEGYGKAIYVTGDDGYVYVMAHLDGFIPKIDSIVKAAQIEKERYMLDLPIEKGVVPVKQGDLIGWTGQTGVGAPHLHFEKRTAGNLPLNPVKNGFSVEDKSPPVFESIGLQLTDSVSLFDDATRVRMYPVKRIGAGKYLLEDTLLLQSPTGILADCFDRTRDDGMAQSCNRAILSIDSMPIFELRFDTLDFEIGSSVNLVYDLTKATDGDKRVVRLFKLPGNAFSGSRVLRGTQGIVGEGESLAPGFHRGKIEAFDPNGNRSTLDFCFVWSPTLNIFTYDSTQSIGDSVGLYYFTANTPIEPFKFDSVSVQVNQGNDWGTGRNTSVKVNSHGAVARVKGRSRERVVLRLAGYSKYGVVITDQPFSGIDPMSQKQVSVDYDIAEDGGLILKLETNALVAGKARFMLYSDTTLLSTVSPYRFITLQRYFAYVAPSPKLKKITAIEVSLIEASVGRVGNGLSGMVISSVGFSLADTLVADSLFQLRVDRQSLFSPRFISVKAKRVSLKSTLNLISDSYKILPEVMPLKGNLEFLLTSPDTSRFYSQSGICWLDEKKDRWVWLGDQTRTGKTMIAKGGGGGLLAAVTDFDPPQLTYRNVIPGRSIANLSPKIEIRIVDSFSGIADDRSFDIHLNNTWMIPEYDPEHEILYIQPRAPLTPGEQRMILKVTDRAGNKLEEIFRFSVTAPEPKSTQSGRKKGK